ncbi:cyclic nucleotide-binding domain-containing protein [Polaromonas sp.]|jgi:CRP-like cAMP-binding protein|uniref:cyclic nucleotide-binding domain-containing protein n=1 Tax=Polaromonas sp. TaxID=1869339 RepID=UPI001A1813F0|nr:cyclic nucleotide-binding domain-containing protein [Burkholderiales bacterium]MBH2018538.1 cyclic nucleotide-binding domain-containing protein [Burkholderiales bacterium]
MKGLLGLIRQTTPADAGSDNPDTFFFSTAFADQGIDATSLVPWEARANEVGAKRLPAERGSKLLQTLWSKDNYMARLGPDAVSRLEKFFDFATLPANRDVIRQDEYGNFMLVLLSGSIAVDREQPWGDRLHLTEARPGDILGEMSLLDSGLRFSVCTSLTDCEIAVLGAQSLDEMMTADPALAASLIALLARKLSRRLRVVSARLSDNKN